MKILCMLLIPLMVLPAFAQADDFILNGRDLPAELEQIPEEYFQPCDTPGTMVRLDYDTWESFSYGSVTTWRTFKHCLPYFRYFMPMSGSLTTNAAYMDAIVSGYGYDWNDYFLFTASGTADFAYHKLDKEE